MIVCDWRRGLARIAGLVLGVIAMAGWAHAAEPSVSKPIVLAQATTPAAKPKIVVATGIDPSFAHYVVAVKKGFFEKHGIDAELRSFDDGNVALDSLLTGAADIGGTSELGGIVRIARGGKLYVMASGIQYADFFGLAGKNSIQKPKDLEGKAVGVPRGSGAHLFMAKYAAFHGIDLAKMNIKFLQAPESVAALARGDIEAFFLWDPWLSRAANSVPDTRIIARSGENNVFRLNTYVFYSQKLLDNKELSQKAMRALIDGAEWAMANRTEASKVVGEAYRMSPADTEKIMQPIQWNIHFDPVFKTYILDAAEFARKAEIIKEIPNLDPFLQPEVLKAVDPARVKGG
jgi:ABC-type nitrate/sulfonate/bicarbonate transport system substrate-binding protein